MLSLCVVLPSYALRWLLQSSLDTPDHLLISFLDLLQDTSMIWRCWGCMVWAFIHLQRLMITWGNRDLTQGPSHMRMHLSVSKWGSITLESSYSFPLGSTHGPKILVWDSSAPIMGSPSCWCACLSSSGWSPRSSRCLLFCWSQIKVS